MLAVDRRRRAGCRASGALRIATAAAGVVALLGLTGCGAVGAVRAHVPCTAMADVTWYPDAASLAQDAFTVLTGAVAGVARADEPDGGGSSTVYTVEVSETLRGDPAPGELVEVRETCTVETFDTQLGADDDVEVLFYTNEFGFLIGQSQGRLVEQDDGTYRAHVDGLETPTVTPDDLALIAAD